MFQKLMIIGRKIAKSGYRLVTSWNDDTLYYSRIYIDKNREKIKKNPMKFMSKLLEINWLCYSGKKEKLQKDLISSEEGIDSYISRPKVFRFAEQFIGYTDLIIDMENCVYVKTKTSNQIYQEVEEYLKIKDFAKVRSAYNSKTLTINQIYLEISSNLEQVVSPDMEIQLYQESIMVNPYIVKALSVIAYNSVHITAYIETNYDKNIYDMLCRKAGIVVNDLETTADKKVSLEYIMREKGQMAKAEKSKRYIFLTSNYLRFKKLYQKIDGKMIFYPSTSVYADEIVTKYLTTGVSKLEKESIAMQLFCGLKPFEYEYTLLYLTKAPVFFHLLERIRKRAAVLDATVIILGDKESKLEAIYMKFFEACRIILWSPLAAYEPKTCKEWKEVLRQYPRLNKIPVERIMFALGIGTMLNGKDTIHTMITKIVQCRMPRNQDEVIRYLNEACFDINSLLLWNPVGGDIMTSTFVEGLQASNPNRKIYFIDDLSEMESEIICNIAEEMEESLPVLLGIFDDNYAFALPETLRTSNSQLLIRVLEDYFLAMYE